MHTQLVVVLVRVDGRSATMKMGRLGNSTKRTDELRKFEAIDSLLRWKPSMTRNLPLPLIALSQGRARENREDVSRIRRKFPYSFCRL